MDYSNIDCIWFFTLIRYMYRLQVLFKNPIDIIK